MHLVFFLLQLVIFNHTVHLRAKIIEGNKNRTGQEWDLLGGVAQHSLLSSTCSTFNPMNHDPNEISSLAYCATVP